MRVTADRSGWLPTSSTSLAHAVDLGPALKYTDSPHPSIKGTPRIGRTLTIRKLKKSGFLPDAQVLTYQWYRGRAKIHGATRLTYKIKKKDKGKRLSVQITAHRTQYAAGTLTLGTTRDVHAL